MLNIVLFEPRIPHNTGAVGRTCFLTGAKLHLVYPMGFSVNDKYIRRSGLDYWEKTDITYYDSVEDFLRIHKDDNLFFFTTKARKVYSDVSYPDDSYLIFGREDRGIDEEILLNHEDFCVRVPMLDKEEARSLNLSNTVAIAAFEFLRQHNFENLLTKGELHNLKWNKEL